jgi:hypothetical protein
MRKTVSGVGDGLSLGRGGGHLREAGLDMDGLHLLWRAADCQADRQQCLDSNVPPHRSSRLDAGVHRCEWELDRRCVDVPLWRGGIS